MTDATYRSVNRAGWDQLTLSDSYSGMLGRGMCAALRRHGEPVAALRRQELDVTGAGPARSPGPCPP